jgi:hypothetical protein
LKTCVTCKHVSVIPEAGVRCRHPESTSKTLNFVTGIDLVEYALCDTARSTGACKPEGLLWEESGKPVAGGVKDNPNLIVSEDFQQQLRTRLYDPPR